MKQKEGVDNHRSLLTWRFGLQVAAILIILAGAAAAPATASAAGCAGTGECYWVGGDGNRRRHDRLRPDLRRQRALQRR